MRYCPDRPFPPYSHIPGQTPHPISDPAGHSYQPPEFQHDSLQRAHAPHSLLTDWTASPEFLYGIDLFNHGYYWEAHETWEQLWIDFRRSGRDADFLKGLIKLAAAGVKAREGRPVGVQRHANRAVELFRIVLKTLTDTNSTRRFGGLDLTVLCQSAESIADSAVSIIGQSHDHSTIVLPVTLTPIEGN